MYNHVNSKDIRNTVSEQIMSSCAGAILTSIFVTPLDVIKTRLQVQQKFVYNSENCTLFEKCVKDFGLKKEGLQCCGLYTRKFNGTYDAFRKILRNEGITSLWSGFSPTLLIAVPANIIYFSLYDQLNLQLMSAAIPFSMSSYAPLISGVSSRIVTGAVVSPIEFLRTKIQSEKVSYSNALRNMLQLVKHRNILALWHGWVPTTLRDVPFSAIYWSIYEPLKRNTNNPSFIQIFIFGATAGTVAGVLTLPFDVIKTIRQAELGEDRLLDKTPGSKQPSTWYLIMRLYQERGIKSLFAGILPRILRIAPGCAVMISSYEVGKSYFKNKRLKYEETDNLGVNS